MEVSGQVQAPANFPPRKEPQIHIVQGTGCTPELVRALLGVKNLHLPEIYFGYPARSLIYIPTVLSQPYIERICFKISQMFLKLLESCVSNLLRQQNQDRRRWNDVTNRFCGLSFIICLEGQQFIMITS
jgi:hypothetical protein